MAAQRIFRKVERELDRLEDIFSLYRPESALVRLNRTGDLPAPPLELLNLLSLCDRLYRQSDGLFDPTVQPLWTAYAEAASTGTTLDKERLEQLRTLIGFDRVSFEPSRIRFARPRMGLTLNGIAQGYVTDRVTDLLRREGLSDIVVDMGEIRASGSAMDGALHAGDEGWPVRLSPDHDRSEGETIRLVDLAVASSSVAGDLSGGPLGAGHVLDPRTGRPATASRLRAVSVIAPSAALADGLSTAALVMPPAHLLKVLAENPGTRARVIDSAGHAHWLKQG
ncbi:FAD:protein FMN transferase [Roseibium aestuarii]|uniref:FAD:protein FMN transferase n=1 Tax=Roseibium aestuarii TaxID=2600299 RepID=A0ABW4K1U3_9HYPH|nr:FAD:protein FMN transferase [Roseibium aestuarii]